MKPELGADWNIFMLDYTLIAALQAVEREGSFRGAARALKLSASAVSQQIKLLEERIGAIVVERSTPIQPTQIGYNLCRHAEKVLSMEEKVKFDNSIILSGDDTKPTAIKIVVDADSLAAWCLDVMQTQIQSGQNWLFDIRCRSHDETQADLLSGRALVAVSTEKKAPQGFTSVYLGKYRYRAVASADFMVRYFKDGVNEETLSKAPVLSGGPNDLQSQWLFESFKKDLSPPTHYVPQSLSFVMATIKNIGWSVNPSIEVQDAIDKGDLVELIPDRFLDRKIYWQYSRAISETVRPITDTVTKIARDSLLQDETPIYRVKLSQSTKSDQPTG